MAQPRHQHDPPAPKASRRDRIYNPYIAIERQMELIRVAHEDGLHAVSMVPGTEYSSRYFMTRTMASEVKRLANMGGFSFEPLLKAATPVFVSGEMQDVIEEAMDTLPDTVSILPHDLQAVYQFIWLERPVRLGRKDWVHYSFWVQGLLTIAVPPHMVEFWEDHYRGLIKDGVVDTPMPCPEVLVYLCGFSVGEDAVSGVEWSYKVRGEVLRDWQFLDVLDWQSWLSTDTLAHNRAYDFGRGHFLQHQQGKAEVEYQFYDAKVEKATASIPLDDYMAHVDEYSYRARQLVAAIVHFMRQRIVRISRETYPLSRQQRRQLEREQKPIPPDPVVSVVKLRSVDYVGRDGERYVSEGGGRTLKERHVQRAHWRNQYYPSTDSHKPKLIPACIKGPEGTPIRGAHKLFAVVR